MNICAGNSTISAKIPATCCICTTVELPDKPERLNVTREVRPYHIASNRNLRESRIKMVNIQTRTRENYNAGIQRIVCQFHVADIDDTIGCDRSWASYLEVGDYATNAALAIFHRYICPTIYSRFPVQRRNGDSAAAVIPHRARCPISNGVLIGRPDPAAVVMIYCTVNIYVANVATGTSTQ